MLKASVNCVEGHLHGGARRAIIWEGGDRAENRTFSYVNFPYTEPTPSALRATPDVATTQVEAAGGQTALSTRLRHFIHQH